MNRREFLGSARSAAAVGAFGLSRTTVYAAEVRAWAEASPLKIAHREGNMLRTDPIPGAEEYVLRRFVTRPAGR